MTFTALKNIFRILTPCVALLLMSCGAIPGKENGTGIFLLDGTDTTASFSGNIAIAESSNRTVMLFDSSLNFVRYLYVGPSGIVNELPFGLGLYDPTNIMVLIDGNDRVIVNSLAAPSALGTILISDAANFVSATRGNVTRLSGGDVLITEGAANTIERFSSAGVRNASGWPLVSLTAPGGIDAITTGVAAGGFVHCAVTSDQARTHAGTGTTLATAATVALHDFIDCVAHTDGRIAAALNGATDRVRIYTDYTMASFCDYSNVTQLVNPLTLDFRPNGNVLVWDGTNRHMLEINSSCSLVATHSSSYLTATIVRDMLVVP